MNIPLYQVNAFANRLFRGNPAAVCPLQYWLPDTVLQGIAAQNNLAETAYYIPKTDSYELRWFTPTVEVDLCGHATLASAYVIWMIRRESSISRLNFESASGPLAVDREDDRYILDFPSRPATECECASSAVGPGRTSGAGVCRTQLSCVFEDEEQVRNLRPDMAKLATSDRYAVIPTAPVRGCDFFSRFFAPAQGIPEDRVTGSAHCTLIPYWEKRMSKRNFFAKQISPRGGELWREDRRERVRIAGNAIKFFEGHIELSDI